MSTVNKLPIIKKIIDLMSDDEIIFLESVMNTKDHKDSVAFENLPEHYDICMAVIQSKYYKPLSGILWNTRNADKTRLVDDYYLIDCFSNEQYCYFYHIVEDRFTRIKEVITLLEIRHWILDYVSQKGITTLLYDDATLGTPTSEKVDAFVRSQGFNESRFNRIRVLISSTKEVWTFISLPTPQWIGGGSDVVEPFTNTGQGTLVGVALDGYVEHLTTDPLGAAHIHGWDKKLDKVSLASILYGTDASNNQTNVKYDINATSKSIVQRDVNGRIYTGNATSASHAVNLQQANNTYVSKRTTTTAKTFLYGYDSSGEKDIDLDSIGRVKDVKVDNVSVVDANGIANISLINKRNVISDSTYSGFDKIYLQTSGGVESFIIKAKQIDSDGLITGNMVKNYVDTQDLLKLDKITGTSVNRKLYAKLINGTQSSVDIDNDFTNNENSNLADIKHIKDFVNSSIQANAANYVTSNASGDNFATRAALLAGPYYHAGASYIITKNDYAVVAADETHDNKQCRYSYDGTQWNYQYSINTTFTAAQQAAIDSGITADKVAIYDGYSTTKMDAENGVGTGTTHLENLILSGDMTLQEGSDLNVNGSATFLNDVVSNSGFKTLSGGTFVKYGYNAVINQVPEVTYGVAGGDTYVVNFPAKSGTLVVSDDLDNLVTLDTLQTITGAKTFNAEIKAKNGLQIENSTKFFNIDVDTSAIPQFKFGDSAIMGTTKTITLPSKDGVVALVSDFDDLVTTNTDQTITGVKTFYNNPIIYGIQKGSYVVNVPNASGTMALTSDLNAITELIPDGTTTANKLVNESSVDQKIALVEAKQVYKTNTQGSFATKDELLNATTFYGADGSVITLTKNDVAYVLADETHDNKTTKYVVASINPVIWAFVIAFESLSLTEEQLAALNSGITATKLASLVTTDTEQEITANKTFKVNGVGTYFNPLKIQYNANNYSTYGLDNITKYVSGSTYTLTYPNKTGTLALTSDLDNKLNGLSAATGWGTTLTINASYNINGHNGLVIDSEGVYPIVCWSASPAISGTKYTISSYTYGTPSSITIKSEWGNNQFTVIMF